MFHLPNTTLKKSLSLNRYYERNSTKQFITGNSTRFGFKLWCITSSEGYLLHAEEYCGADTDLSHTGLGRGSDVVLGLIEKCEIKVGSTVKFYSQITSLLFLDELIELEISALGTLLQIRFHHTPVANKTTLAKKPKGSYNFTTDGQNLEVSWLGNKDVACATSYVTCNPVTATQR